MKENTQKNEKDIGVDFFTKSWEHSWTYIKTVVDVVREPMVILGSDFYVLAANDPFYETFQVTPQETIGNLLFELGNGQWKIPTLQKFLQDILPKQTFFKGFQVAHDFPSIGRKVIIINGRQLHFKDDAGFQEIILLAMEDVTEMIAVAERMADHVNTSQTRLAGRSSKMEIDIGNLQAELTKLQEKG